MKNQFKYLLLAILLLPVLMNTAQAQLKFTGSAQRPGSVLFYNIYTSKVDNPGGQNTRINLTNLAQESVIVHWFFVDSVSCTVADAFTCLTASQTLSFLSSDYDPDMTGYVVAVAVDDFGNPRDFDHLIGSEYVKFASGHQAKLTAEVAAVVNHPLVYYPVPGSGGTQVDLAFDDASYERLPFDLALNNLPSSNDNNETMIVINRIGGDLGDKVNSIGALGGLLYNDAEKSFSLYLRN